MQTKRAVRIDSSGEILSFIVLAVLPRGAAKRQEIFDGLSVRTRRRDDQILIFI